MKHQQTKKRKTNFRLKTFLVFLSLSMLFWMLIKLSKTYTSDVVFEVNYQHLPIDKIIENELVTEINTSVISTGFNLLSYKLNKRKLRLDVSNLSFKKGKEYYYLPNRHLSKIKAQLDVETTIVSVAQDSIFFVLGKNKTKKVPIKLDAAIQFKLGYNYATEIVLMPNFVTITGTEAQLDTITEIKTEKIELIAVSSDIKQEVALSILDYKNSTFSSNIVLVTAKVDKFTEGSLTVPFKILNLPKNYSITTFPTEVKVIYQVGLSNFNKITTKNIEVVCDFKYSEKNNLSYLIPKLKEKSPLITSVRIVPNKIEFLIEEK